MILFFPKQNTTKTTLCFKSETCVLSQRLDVVAKERFTLYKVNKDQTITFGQVVLMYFDKLI